MENIISIKIASALLMVASIAAMISTATTASASTPHATSSCPWTNPSPGTSTNTVSVVLTKMNGKWLVASNPGLAGN